MAHTAAEKLFTMALIAVRGRPVAGAAVDIGFGLDVWAVMATTCDEALGEGTAKALEFWPTTEGWFGHTVRVAEIHMRSNFPAINDHDSFIERVM